MEPPTPGAVGASGPAIIAATLAQTGVATLMVLLRACSDLCITKAPGKELYFAVAAWVFAVGSEACGVSSALYGLGNHAQNLDPKNYSGLIKYTWASEFLAIASTIFGKIAITALLFRINGPQRSTRTWILHIIWVSTAVLGVMQIIFLFFECVPERDLFNLKDSRHCQPTENRNLITATIQGIWSAVTDAGLALWPAFIFSKLRISLVKKVGLSFLMAGGLITAAITLTRIYYLFQVDTNKDVTFSLGLFIVCQLSEAWSIIILGSVPPLRALVVRTYGKTLSKISTARSGQASGQNEIGLTDWPAHPKIRSGLSSTGRSEAFIGTSRPDSLREVLVPDKCILVEKQYDVAEAGEMEIHD